jgi:hypothetical protein
MNRRAAATILASLTVWGGIIALASWWSLR